MKKTLAFALLGMLFATAPAAAQTFGFGAHAGVSIPTGDYGDLAGTGFSGGLDLWYPLTMAAPGLSWYTSADVTAHGLEGDGDGGFLYIPLMTGLRFDIPVGTTMAAFVTGQLGLIFNRGPDLDFGIGEVNAETGTNFGFNFGGGLQLTDNIYAGVKYYPLGDTDFEYEGADNPAEFDVSFLDIYVGFGVH
jgi:opacity protein-like surface antigen